MDFRSYLNNLIRSKEEQKEDLKRQIKQAETADEVRALGETLDAVLKELTEAKEQLAKTEDEKKPAEPGDGAKEPAPEEDPQRSYQGVRTQVRGGEILGAYSMGGQEKKSAGRYDTEEYRKAFMEFACRNVPMPEEYRADAVLVATGGVSYPTTGSTGDGYKLAQQAGHTLIEPVPSLVSLVSHDADCKKMMGLALKNVTLTLFEDSKAIFDEQGEMLFTHFGISGPLTLSASSHLGDMKKHKYHAEIDLKPALSEEQLYDRITRDFALLANHAAQGALVKLLPSSMQPVMVARWGIDPATKANQITREQKRELVQLMKHWRVSIDARGDLAHAVITSGGVSVREVDPKTMQSKKAMGLYFAGEVLDVDAYTGGYNLQIAFCTAQAFANHL